MMDAEGAGSAWDTFLDNFAAKLTLSVYPVALRQGTGGSWLDLEINLWAALAETSRRWGRELPRAGPPDEFDLLWGIFLVELTGKAFTVALRQGMKGGSRETETRLYQAFRTAIEEVGREALLCRGAADRAPPRKDRPGTPRREGARVRRSAGAGGEGRDARNELGDP